MIKKVSVIIVSYNSANELGACVNSVLTQKNCVVEVIVVDNASADNSLAVLEFFGHKINVVKNTSNMGFAKANNIGFEQSSGDYIFLLNPDAVLCSEHGLEQLIHYMDEFPRCGVVGPKINCRGSVTPPQWNYVGEKYLTKPLEALPGKIAWVVGASMFIRRDVYEKIKGFDEDYFLYGEETDFCLRVRRAGWEIAYFDGVEVNHIAGVSTRSFSMRELWTKQQTGAILFYKKSYGTEEAKRLIERDLKLAKRKLFFRKFFKNAKKQEKYEAIRDVCYSALRFLRE